MKSDGINKELLYEEYIVKNKRRHDLASELGIGDDWLKKLLQRYGIRKDQNAIFENVKETNMQKYGAEFPFQNEDIANEATKKMKETYSKKPKKIIVSAKRYREISKSKEDAEKKDEQDERIVYVKANPEIWRKYSQKKKEERQKENEEKAKEMGVTLEEYLSIKKKEAVQKSRETVFQKYGCRSTVSLKLPSETRNIFSSGDELSAFIRNNPIDNIFQLSEKLGCAISTLYEKIREYGLIYLLNERRYSSAEETKIENFLKEKGIRFVKKDRQIIKPFEIDIFCPDIKIGIEYNGDYWHSSQFKRRGYHKYKSCRAAKEGVFLYQIFEFRYKEKGTYYINFDRILQDLGLFLDGTKEKEKMVFLQNTKEEIVLSDPATEPDKWFEEMGFECFKYSWPKKNIGKMATSSEVVVYDCGTKFWRRKTNGKA